MKKLLIVIALGLVVIGGAVWAYSADPDKPGPSSWVEPADYSYRVSYGVFGPAAGTYDITVRNHSVVAIESVPELNYAIEEGWIGVDTAWTLADLEARYDEAKADPEGDATITYDPVTGAPSEIILDWIIEAVDDEEGFTVIAFDPEG